MPLRTNGPEIRRRRELAGMTQIEFANAIGYDANYLSQIELGYANGGPRFHKATAEHLNCTIADITSGGIPWGSVATAMQKESAA